MLLQGQSIDKRDFCLRLLVGERARLRMDGKSMTHSGVRKTRTESVKLEPSHDQPKVGGCVTLESPIGLILDA